MASALDWLMQQLGRERQDTSTPGDQVVRQDASGNFVPYKPPSGADALQMLYEMTGVPGMQSAQAAWDRGEYLPAIGQEAASVGQLASSVLPVARGLGAAGKFAAPVAREMAASVPDLLADEAGALNPRFTIRKSYDLPADGAGEKNAYAIHSPEGAPVGGAHITISPDGRVADVGNVWAGDPDLPNNIALDPSAANAANTLGPRAMRQVVLDFFHGNPSVEEIMGERISGARETPGGASVTRSQFSGALDQLRQLLGDESGALKLPGGGPIRAYHGSPHDFDRFDLSKIGTGEGAQGYGHGLYFSEAPSVARTYQSSVSAIRDAGKPTVDGRSIDWNNPFETAAFELMRHNGDRAAAADFFERTFAKGSSVPGILRSDAALPEVKPPGRMYEVNLHADPEAFLNYDKPLSEQPGIQSVFDRLGMTAGPRWELLPKSNLMSGGSRLSPQESSAALSQAGVPGIRYLDQGSRGAGAGSSNYVMFDDKLIEILRKYGLAGLTAGTGAAALGGSAEAAPADALDRIRRQLGEGAF